MNQTTSKNEGKDLLPPSPSFSLRQQNDVIGEVTPDRGADEP